MKDLFEVWGALKFLFIGPLILALLFVINLLTSPGDWWIQWPTLGIGIACVICFLRVLKPIAVLGGLAVLISWLQKRSFMISSRSKFASASPSPRGRGLG